MDFGATPNHGITREIPTLVEYDIENDEIIFVTPVSVQRDGATETFEANETFDVMEIRIGDPAVEITGAHRVRDRVPAVVAGISELLDTATPAYEFAGTRREAPGTVPIEAALR